jgi:hypothetical protein
LVKIAHRRGGRETSLDLVIYECNPPDGTMALMTGDVVTRSDIAVDVSVEEILATPPFPRWASSSKRASQIAQTVERLAEPLADALEASAMYRAIPTTASGIDAFDPPADLTRVEFVVPGVLTIGDGLHQSGSTDGLLDALVADAMENVALQFARVEMLADIRDAAQCDGFKTTRAFPPGVRGLDWSIENRRFMFETLPTELIGVSLRNGRVTDPRKTFTFAMGVDADIEQADLFVSCTECEYSDTCPYVGSTFV